jgi:F420-dependent oxidoreductase-like protein
MRLGFVIGAGPSMRGLANEVVAFERAGLDSVTVSEAYTFDAVSQLGYLAARTERVELATGILPLFSRTPTMMAMTAAGLDFVADGRFRLGIGASGPQVVEGFHGVRYDSPLARIRETIDICRMVWRREKLSFTGKQYQIPATSGSGEGKPLKLINQPVRNRIPITVAGTGERTVALAAEMAEGWEPIFFHPERAKSIWREALTRGKGARFAELAPLEVCVRVPVAVGEDTSAEFEAARAQLALYIGGMGPRGHNFYNDLARRYGYEEVADEVQDLYLAGRIGEARARVPDELVDATSLVGTAGHVRERLGAFADAGVTMINMMPLSANRAHRLRAVELLRDAID